MSKSAAARPFLNSLTAMRGIAAWMVVFYHIRAGMPWLPEGVRHIFAKGYLAVDFFFLLSGFVIYLSAHADVLARGKAAIMPFLARRLARIYPLYAVILLPTIAFALVLTLTGRDISGYPWGELPLHIMMMQNWGFTDVLSWNHPAWSISTEMAAYLLFPLLVLYTPIPRLTRFALLLGIIMTLGVMGAWLYQAGINNLGEYIAQFGLIRCLFEFSAGTMLCALWLRSEGARNDISLRIAVVVAVAGSALCWLVPRGELWGFPVMAAALIFLLAELSRSGRIAVLPPLAPIARALIYLGEISYATYLAHYMGFTWFKIILVNRAGDISPWKIMLFLLLLLGISSLLYHSIEKPGRRIFTLLSQNRGAGRNHPARSLQQ